MIPRVIPNPTREPVTEADVCAIASRWGISPVLANKLVSVAGSLAFEIWIFSGARGADEQREVSPTPFDLSTHADLDARRCPRLATGADVQPLSPAVRILPAAVAQMGAAAVLQGLRWGGGAPHDDRGIPVGKERWHFDLGPRSS